MSNSSPSLATVCRPTWPIDGPFLFFVFLMNKKSPIIEKKNKKNKNKNDSKSRSLNSLALKREGGYIQEDRKSEYRVEASRRSLTVQIRVLPASRCSPPFDLSLSSP